MKGQETALVAGCIATLKGFGIFCWRNNSGAMRAGGRFIRFGQPGSPDIIGVMEDGRFLGVECKVGRNKPTEQQSVFLNEIRRRGGVALLVYELDDLVNGIREATK